MIDELAAYLRFWPYAAAVLAGVICAIIDRQVIGRYVIAILLVLIAMGGQVAMYVSPFTFGGGDYYMTGLIASLMAVAALAGYALAVAAMFACAKMCRGKAA